MRAIVKKIFTSNGMIYGMYPVQEMGHAATFCLLFSTSRHRAGNINGNLLIADTGNNCVRKVNASDQSIVTIAGNALPVSLATVAAPIQHNSTYLGDRTCRRQHIYADSEQSHRKIDASTGVITHHRGKRIGAFTGDTAQQRQLIEQSSWYCT